MKEVFWLLLFFQWPLKLPQTYGKEHAVICTMTDLFQIPYEYYKTGDVTIGAISTQFNTLFEAVSFSEHPQTKFVDELM